MSVSPAARTESLPADVAPPQRRARALERGAFALLVALHLAPIWLLAFVPTQDGPAHLENALALLRRGGVPVLAAFYEPNLRLLPNWLGHGLLAALLSFLPPLLAEKIFLSGYVVGLPLAFRAALPARARRRGFALVVFPFVYSLQFYMGFSSFCWSLVLYFAGLAAWRRRRGGWHSVALAAVALAMAAGHAVTLVAFVATVGAMSAWDAFLAARRARSRARRRLVLRAHAVRTGVAALALAPAAALVVALAITGVEGHGLSFWPPGRRLFAFGTLLSLVSMSPADLTITTALAAAIACALLATAWARRHAPAQGTPWLAASGALALLALLSPDAIGRGWGMTLRLQVFPYTLAVCWIGAGQVLPLVGRALPAAATAVSLALLASHAPFHVRLSDALEEYVSVAPLVERGSVVLPLQLTAGRDVDPERPVPLNFAPLLHAAGYVAAARDAVDLANYEASTSVFPLRFRPERNPYVLLARGPGFEGEGSFPCVDLTAGGEAIRVDYVVVWGPLDAARGDPCGRLWLGQLASGWERVQPSRPDGRVQLWRRR